MRSMQKASTNKQQNFAQKKEFKEDHFGMGCREAWNKHIDKTIGLREGEKISF